MRSPEAVTKETRPTLRRRGGPARVRLLQTPERVPAASFDTSRATRRSRLLRHVQSTRRRVGPTRNARRRTRDNRARRKASPMFVLNRSASADPRWQFSDSNLEIENRAGFQLKTGKDGRGEFIVAGQSSDFFETLLKQAQDHDGLILRVDDPVFRDAVFGVELSFH